MGVHELDGHGAFADCRCAALGRTGTDISGRKDPWHARLEQKSAACSLASKDESIFISRDDVAKPLRARCRTQKQKKKREWNALPALQSDSLEASRFAVQIRDLASIANEDAVPLEFVDQVVGHRLAKVGPAVKEGDERAAARKPNGRLAGGITTADNPNT